MAGFCLIIGVETRAVRRAARCVIYIEPVRAVILVYAAHAVAFYMIFSCLYCKLISVVSTNLCRGQTDQY